jgi:hypothetical protein
LGSNKEVVMFKFKENANPVGVAHKIAEIEDRLVKYARFWDEHRVAGFWGSKIDRSKLTHLMLAALDDFITTVALASIPGPDKKATVLDAMDRLYEYTVREALPIWIRPFAEPVKRYAIYILVSYAIDWAVEKYKSGSWTKGEALERILKKAGCGSLPCIRCTRRDA